MDYYKILNLKEDASLKEIEQAYKDLASFYNPNTNSSKVAYKKFREINKAYNILKETKSRELYKLSIKDEIVVKEVKEANRVDLSDFDIKNYNENDEDISKYKDVVISDKFADYSLIKISVPYLYYLLNCEYEVTFAKKEIVSSFGECEVCKGLGKVRNNQKVILCNECLGSGKKIETREVISKVIVDVDEKIIDDENKIIVEFEFKDKHEYEIKGNVIEIKHEVSNEEFYNGVYFEFKKNDSKLIIEEKEFKELKKSYVFLDKVINIEYILTSYKGKDLKGYLLTNKEVIYLNPNDYSYSFNSSDLCTLKVEINDKKIILVGYGEKGYKSSNGDLILNVIKVENNNDLKIFFNRKIKKISKSYFSSNNDYLGNNIVKQKNFGYDNNFIYLVSFAYKIKLKYFTLFKILALIVPILFMIISFMIFGLSYIFFIVSFILLAILGVGINLMMEVKV